jgi:anti-anti-sigma factor
MSGYCACRKITEVKNTSFKIMQEEQDGIVVISIIGTLVSGNFKEFQKILADLDNQGKINVVLDMQKCTYITSMNLSAILSFKKKFIAKGGDLKLAQINTLINDLFEKINLKRVLNVYDTVESAIASFN